MPTDQPARYRFGVFELDAATGELRRKGLRVRLHTQPCQLLLLLLDRPGELVTREQIITALWPDGTFVDYEHGINSAIARLRDALGDTAGNSRFVETLARRGYRFIHPVQSVAADPSDLPPDPIPTQPQTLGAPSLTQALPRQGWETTNPAALADFTHPQTPGAPSMPQASSRHGWETTNPAALADFTQPQTPGAPSMQQASSRHGWESTNSPTPTSSLLAAPHELPRVSHPTVHMLYLGLQLMYLGFYIGALANLPEINDLFSNLPHAVHAFALLIATAAILIPVRAFTFTTVLLRAPHAPQNFFRLWPLLLAADELWALSPFLLLHHINFGVALACTALLVYSPFAQRSLILMGAAQRPA